VDYQLECSRSIVRTAQRQREAILLDSWRMARDATALGGDRHVHVRGADREALAELSRILGCLGVQHASGEEVRIPLGVPQARLILELFGKQTYPLADRPYDVTAWTLSWLLGLEHSICTGDCPEPIPAGPPMARPSGRIGLYKPWDPSMDEGWTRLVLERFGIPYRSLDKIAGLDALDCVILPDFKEDEPKIPVFPKEYRGTIGKEGFDALRKFVEGGGTLVCIGDSCGPAIEKFGLPVKVVSDFTCPGSILRCEVDTAHRIGRGMPAKAMLFQSKSIAFRTSPPSRADVDRRVVVRYPETGEVLASGYLKGEVRGLAALVEVTVGKGRVVLFGFRPQYRAQTWGTFRLFFNALGA
jgi:hypothetical protein